MEADVKQRIAAALAGDVRAADSLIEEFHARVYAFLRRLAGNDADAEDLTQRTFARVWQSLASFEGRSSISAWIHGIAHHVYLDWRRAPSRAEAQTDEWWAARPAGTPTPAECAESSDLAGAVFAAVDHLEPDLRATVHLHFYQGLTLQETADALGVATSTVKYRVRGAVDELQSALVRRPGLSRRVQNL